MIKVAVVGCGGIGLSHIKAYGDVPEVSITSCVDRDISKARKAAGLCGAKALDDISRIPDDVDAVNVVTPPSTHYALASELLRHGFHVFCEKPLTMQTSQAEELATIARKGKRVLMVGFKMRFEPVFQRAKKYIKEIGDLRAVSTIKQQPYHSRPDNDWIPGVGAMYELSVHEFDLVHWLGDVKPQKVLSAELGHRLGWKKEDSFFITVRYSRGVTGHLQGMYSPEGTFLYRDITMTFLGEKGYMRVERPDRIALHTSKFTIEHIKDEKVNTFSRELTHFRDVISGRAENIIGPDCGVMTTKLIESARLSYENKKVAPL